MYSIQILLHSVAHFPLLQNWSLIYNVLKQVDQHNSQGTSIFRGKSLNGNLYDTLGKDFIVSYSKIVDPSVHMQESIWGQ